MEAELNSVVHSGLGSTTDILVVTHPKSDPKNPNSVGSHEALCTDNVGEILNRITPTTGIFAFDGLSLYEDGHIVDLVDGLLRKGRTVFGSTLNLNDDGLPPNHLPALISLADRTHNVRTYCANAACFSTNAQRSRWSDGYSDWKAYCLTHHYHPEVPGFSLIRKPSLWVRTGPVCSSKTIDFRTQLESVVGAGRKPIVFTWTGDVRYEHTGITLKNGDPCEITSHNDGIRIPAIAVDGAQSLMDYVRQKEQETGAIFTDIFIDEMQLLDLERSQNSGNGVVYLHEVVDNLLDSSRNVHVAGLVTDFKRDPFFRAPYLVAMATSLKWGTAYCTWKEVGDHACVYKATQSQRLITSNGTTRDTRWDEGNIVEVAGGERIDGKFSYAPRCRVHHTGARQLEDRFANIPGFKWKDVA